MPVARDADSGARPRRASSRQPAPHLCSHRRLQGALGAGAPAVAARPQPRPPACDCPAHLAPTCPRLPGWGGGTSEEGVPWLPEGVQLRDLITSGPWGQSTPSGALASELLKVPTVCQMVSWRLDVQWSKTRAGPMASRVGEAGGGQEITGDGKLLPCRGLRGQLWGCMSEAWPDVGAGAREGFLKKCYLSRGLVAERPGKAF